MTETPRAYEAMARRYRPTTFSELVGQEHVATTLQNAITAGRVAHAYLFCGPHGCGKTSMARIFAKALVCEQGPTATPCGTCDLCRDILRGVDVDVQEIDGASNNGVEQVRQLREQASYIPNRARFKIYIIDEVHMLSLQAFNALLKTLEEPPAHVKFILATTDPHKIPDTVLSRCQRFDFRLVPPPALAAFFKELAAKEEAAIEDEALEAVAAYAGGSVRDGLVLLDQLLSYADGAVTREDVERVRGVAAAEAVAGLFEAICAHDTVKALGVVDEVAQQGVNVGDYLDQLIAFGRDLMVMVATGKSDGIAAYGPARASLERLAEEQPLDQVLLMLDVFAEARTRVRSRALSNPLVPLEMAVARLAGLDTLAPVGDLLQKLDALASGAPLPEPAAPKEKKTAPIAAEAQPVSPPAPVAPPPVPDSSPPPVEDALPVSIGEEYPLTSKPPEPPFDPDPVPPVMQKETPNSPQSEPLPLEAPAAEAWAGAADASLPQLTLEQARAAWPAVLAAMEEARSPDLPYLRDSVEVHAVDRESITLSVPGLFHFEQLEDPKRKARIGEAIAGVLKQPLSLQLHLNQQQAGPAAQEPAPAGTHRAVSVEARARELATRDPLVQSVMEAFDGHVLDVKDDLEL